MTQVPHGQIVFVEDLLANPRLYPVGSSLRVLGRAGAWDVVTNRGILTVADTSAGMTDSKLVLDLSLLSQINFADVGALYQCFGELAEDKEGTSILVVRVLRNVEGLDIALYKQAMLLQHQFIASLPLST